MSIEFTNWQESVSPKQFTEQDMLLAIEFGYKSCEKGNNIQKIIENFKQLFLEQN